MTGGRLKPSDMILVSFDIIKDGLKPSPLNRVYSCYGHPDDGPATLTLRDSDGVVSIVHVEPITSLEENPHTGNTHFTGELIDGGSISGHFLSGSATAEIVGKATIAL